MKALLRLFFRVTNRLFAFFMDYLGRVTRGRHPDLSRTQRKRLLIVRQGGLGDLLFVSAIIQEIKRRHPQLAIDLMCHPQYHGAFFGSRTIDRLLDHRWPSVWRLLDYDYRVFLDGVVERDPDARLVNIYDLFARKYFGLEMPRWANRPSIVVDPSAVRKMRENIPELVSAPVRIGLQPFANSPVRTPSAAFWTRTATSMLRRIPEATLVVLAEKSRAPAASALVDEINRQLPSPRALSTAGTTEGVAELAALVSMLDGVLAPDSSVAHLAAAFDVPALAVYGPFPAALRVRDYRSTYSIEGPAPCAPCFTHGHWPCAEARKRGQEESPCFDMIVQKTIDDTVDALVPLIRRRAINTAETDPHSDPSGLVRSETSKFSGEIIAALEAALGNGLARLNGAEIGSGGDPLTTNAVALDLAVPYTRCGAQPIHLKGDCRRLPWFADGVLDYIYSSHLFEDFPEPENRQVLAEWLRVIRPGGVLALLLPDQYRYLAHCKSRNELPNEHHSIADFGPAYILRLTADESACSVESLATWWSETSDEYNFLVLLRKSPAQAVS